MSDAASCGMTTVELLIKAADAIAELAELLEESGSAEGDTTYEEDLAAQLRAAAERERWVPVGERLPEDGERVFVKRTSAIPSIVEGRHHARTREWFAEGCHATVTHWRPLPEGPE